MQTINCRAFLFDMDGTIADSVHVAIKVWSHWARKHGLDVDEVLKAMHGVRAEETVRRFLPDGDVAAEAEWMLCAELNDMEGVRAIPGAPDFVGSLPRDCWAVVTSANRELALARLAAAGLPTPPVLVAAEDIAQGKPAPDCFLLGARRLGADPAECVVFEDAPAGITAAQAAGCQLIVITHTHDGNESLPAAPALANYHGLCAKLDSDDRFRLNLAAASAVS